MTETPQRKERPMLFSGEMVRAILAGRKTQTRRVVKPQPVSSETGGLSTGSRKKAFRCPVGLTFSFGSLEAQRFLNWLPTSELNPYGKPGDRLWVRETFQPIWATDKPGDWNTGEGYKIGYVATDGIQDWCDEVEGDGSLTQKCKPSIHMPRWASRLTLEITAVRVERLQEINAKDILAEGAVARAHDDQFGHNPVSAFDGKVYLDLKTLWASGWESINGKGSWKLNPWVWVVEFKRV